MSKNIFAWSQTVVSRGLSKLIPIFQTKLLIRGWLSSNLERQQEIENSAESVSNILSINNGVGGVQLDRVGLIVGRGRAGFDDEDFRRGIQAQIAINKSQGRDVDIYNIFSLSLKPTEQTTITSWLWNLPNLNWVLYVFGAVDFGPALWANISQVRNAGVRGDISVSTADVNNTFTLRLRQLAPAQILTRGFTLRQAPSLPGGVLSYRFSSG